MRLPHRTTLPGEVRGWLRLQRGERVLSHAATAEGTLVATTHALHLPDGHAVPWQHIDRVRWSESGIRFTEEGAGERTFTVSQPGRLAETVYERVTATIVVSRHLPLEDGGLGYRLVARRPPGGSAITWQIHVDDGVDPQDPRLADHAAHALTALRDQLGI